MPIYNLSTLKVLLTCTHQFTCVLWSQYVFQAHCQQMQEIPCWPYPYLVVIVSEYEVCSVIMLFISRVVQTCEHSLTLPIDATFILVAFSFFISCPLGSSLSLLSSYESFAMARIWRECTAQTSPTTVIKTLVKTKLITGKWKLAVETEVFF